MADWVAQQTIDDNDWDLLVERVRNDECVPFLGAGASMTFDGGRLPTARDLAGSLADELKYGGRDRTDFFKIAQLYEFLRDEKMLRRAIRERIMVPGATPSRLHLALAELPFTYVLTTNYDDLLERAFSQKGKACRSVYYDVYGANTVDLVASERRPMVYKLHGSFERESSMICTEDEIVQFIANIVSGGNPLPIQIKNLFRERTLLFIGYGLRDWNIRVLIRAMRENPNRRMWNKSFALQRRPDDELLARDWDDSVIYWVKKENVKCCSVEAEEFMIELSRRYHKKFSGAV